MKNRLKTVIKTYMKYFIGNIGKLLFFLAIVIYLHSNEIDFIKLSKNILFYYIGYTSIYFFNDYIDRDKDLKRKLIFPIKLVLTKEELLILGIISILISSIAFIILREYIVLFLTLINIFIGIFRSFSDNKELREISLILLSFFKMYTVYYITYETLNVSYYVLLIFIYISLLYGAYYYLHKYYKEVKIIRKIIYIGIYSIFTIFLAISYINLQNVLISLFIIMFYISFLICLLNYKKLVKEDNKRFVKLLSALNIVLIAIALISILIKFLFIR